MIWCFPHVRGANDLHPVGIAQNGRFIPTCVGQMQRTIQRPSALLGSSPRAWGKFRLHEVVVLVPRFIPTCVGQIYMTLLVAVWYIGSSPREWGKCHHTSRAVSCARFIPTCVGQMRPVLLSLVILHGSSPRAWGYWGGSPRSTCR